MRGLVAEKLAEEVVDFAGLYVVGEPNDEERADLVARRRCVVLRTAVAVSGGGGATLQRTRFELPPPPSAMLQ